MEPQKTNKPCSGLKKQLTNEATNGKRLVPFPHNDEADKERIYNPFGESDDEGMTDNTQVNPLINRLYPFSDNRPICNCDTVRRMTGKADARYALSLLPDMAQMNKTQKSAFKNGVMKLLEESFAESDNYSS